MYVQMMVSICVDDWRTLEFTLEKGFNSMPSNEYFQCVFTQDFKIGWECAKIQLWLLVLVSELYSIFLKPM